MINDTKKFKKNNAIHDKWWPELKSAITSEKSPLWANDSSGGWELKNKLAHTEEVHIGVVDGEVHLFEQVWFVLTTFFLPISYSYFFTSDDP